MMDHEHAEGSAAIKISARQGARLHRVPKELLRYGIAGVLLNAGGFVAYFWLTIAGFDPKAALTISFIGQVIAGFPFNRDWTFRARVGFRDGFPHYAGAYIGAYLVNLAGLYVFVDLWGYSYIVVQIVLTVVIAIGLFLVQRHWIFARAGRTDRQ